MKRVGLYLGVESNAGGMFQYALSILDALAALPRDEFQVNVICTGSSWPRYLAGYAFSRLEVKGGRLGLTIANLMMALRMPSGLCRTISPYVNPIANAMLSSRCDLWIFPAQDVLAYQAPVRSMAAIHDLMHRYEGRFPEVSSSGRYAMREQRFGGIARWACGMLVDSQVGMHHVQESYGVQRERIFVLPYVAPRYIGEPSAPGFEHRYSLPKKFAFYPAQFWPHKNHKRLVSAAASLKARIPDIHLVFSGSPAHGYRDLVQHIVDLDMVSQVTFIGRVPDSDMSELYRRARCLVMPTFFGPTNIPPLEAFSLGCPVAISSTYGMPEQADGAALLFDPASTREIAESLFRLWTDESLCQKLRLKGLERTATWNQHAFNLRFRNIVDTVLAS
jgi:glycosyltransferase involved in cell wall biosynthesis